MTDPAEALYLDLLKRTLTGMVYEDPPIPAAWHPGMQYNPAERAVGGDWPTRAHTMVGLARLDNLQECIEQVLADRVPGDLIECLPGEALVSVPAGTAVRAIRRSYSGPLVKITSASGHQLTATPEHPVLTRRGWVPAGAVEEGDYVVSRAGLERMRLSNPDIDDVPAPISEVYEALESRRSKRRPFEAVHFDVCRPCGQVQVVPANSSLALSRMPAFSEPSRKQCFPRTDLGLVTFPGGYLPGQGFTASALSLRGQRAERQCSPDKFRVALGSAEQGVSPGMLCIPGPAHGFPDRTAVPPVFGSESPDGLASKIPADSVIGVRAAPGCGNNAGAALRAEDRGLTRGTRRVTGPVHGAGNRCETPGVPAGNDSQGFPSQVAADRIISIRTAPYRGHVYNLQTTSGWYLAENILVHNCGVWRGGACIFMRGVLKAHGVTSRNVWIADSFQGFPQDTPRPADRSMATQADQVQLAVPEAEVRRNFGLYGLLDDQVRFLPGFFADTLPSAPVKQLAVLRLDGDLYASTMDALVPLYPRVEPGGYVIIDDYQISMCKDAVTDYRGEHGVTSPIRDIDGCGVFWRKE